MKKSSTHIIDVANQPLGRLAGQIALILRGKQTVDFVPYRLGSDRVVVKNVDKLLLTGKKLDQKTYFSHSGYPKGEKHTKIKGLIEKRPSLVLRRAVLGMLPHNRLSAQAIKRLSFE